MAASVGRALFFAGMFLFSHYALHFVADLSVVAVSGSLVGAVVGIVAGRARAAGQNSPRTTRGKTIMAVVILIAAVVPLLPFLLRTGAPEAASLADDVWKAFMEEALLASSVFDITSEMTYWREREWAAKVRKEEGTDGAAAN
jgi:hypothetical protein